MLPVLVTALVVFSQSEDDRPATQRIIWVAVDSLRADHLHFMGYQRETSPWLDECTKASAVFTKAYVPANSTAFSVAATFAGIYYSLLAHDSYPAHIPRGVTTLPESLQRGGFQTHAWIANGLLTSLKQLGYSRGFDEWHDILSRGSPGGTIDEITTCVNEFYDGPGGPEFHYVHTMDVHAPYTPPIPFDRLWPDHPPTRAVRFGELLDADGECVLSNLPYHSQAHSIQDRDIEFLMTQYDGAIRFTDARLPSLLDAMGYDPDTDFLIVSADHGEQFFEHGFWGHGKGLYPEEIHVPLLIRGPGIPPGRHEVPVSLVDLFPTLCALLDLETPPGLSGNSLLPVLLGKDPVPTRPVYTEAPYWTGKVFAPEAAVIHRNDLYRIVASVYFLRPWAIWPVSEELFQLDIDASCTENLARTWNERADEMNDMLRKINPRFASYEPQLIRGDAEEVTFGPNVMPNLTEPNNPSVRVRPSTLRRAMDGTASLHVPDAALRVFVHTLPGQTHLIEFRYLLVSGSFEFTLCGEHSGEPFWQYTLRKPSLDWQTLRAMVKPRQSSSRFSVQAIVPGRIRLRDVSLRSAKVPHFDTVTWRNVGALREEAPAMDPHVQATLEALGYAD